VNAVDVDGTQAVLTYQWTVPSGQGTLSQADSANPLYTPGDVTGTQEITLTVSVSNQQYTVSRDVVVTVFDRDEILLIDSFENGANNWDIKDEGTEDVPSQWIVENETFVQRSHIYTPEPASTVDKQGTYALYDAPSASDWSDYRVGLTMQSQDDGYIGVMFRVLDKDNFYRFSWSRQDGYAYLTKCENKNFTLIAQQRIQYNIGQVYDLDIIARGSLIQVFIDGERLMELTDGTFTQGTIALYSYANAGSYFDNILVKKLS
jgi:hypothetical protein